MPAERAERQYRFEPLDTSGVFLGLGFVQCLFLGGGLVAAVVGLTAGVPLPVCVVPVLGAVALSFARVRGRTAWQWLPLLVGWTWTRAGRGRRWLAPLPLLPMADGYAAPLPPCLAGARILEVPWRGSLRLGAVEDTERHTLTALVRVTGPQFVVQPRIEQERLLAGWGDVLNQYAVERGVVVHLSWSDFAQHSGLEQHRAWLASVDRGDVPATAADSYRELLGEAAGTATTHDVVL
ncbi:MAG: SCO6880 family protein, partial [Acidimicrobiia bacterium]